MISISICMIVKNEEAVLARCLDSVKDLADELVIVDTGSTDRTREIAAGYGAKVFDFPWIDDFSAARNFSFAQATREYCMWLDADDVLLPGDQRMLADLKETLSPEINVVMCRYHTAFDEMGRPAFSYYRERLLRREAGLLWEGAVHEAIAPAPPVLFSELAVTHQKNGPGDSDRNLRILENRQHKGLLLSPREQFYYGRELFDHGRFAEGAEVLEAFLDQGQGWLENNIESCRVLSSCRYALHQPQKALLALLQSLAFDTPRAEVCCDIGRHFFDRSQWRQAIFWYELALGRERNDQSGGFVLPDCYDYIPALQLCVCFDRLGDHKTAQAFNELAGRVKPESPAYQYNKQYFADLLSDPAADPLS